MTVARRPLIELLTAWLPAKRWFPAQNEPFELRMAGGLDIPITQASVARLGKNPPEQLKILILAVKMTRGVEVLQLPLSFRSQPLPAIESAAIGELEGVRLYDAIHDPWFIDAWLAFLGQQSPVHPDAERPDTEACPFRAGCSDELRQILADPEWPSSWALGGEQSNSSVVVPHPRLPVITKFFRILHEGQNPDVEIGRALSSPGLEDIPRLHGWAEGGWDVGSGPVLGSLGVVHRFVPGAQDGWTLAVTSACQEQDFSREAAELGAALARLHDSLRAAFGGGLPEVEEAERVLGSLVARIRWAWQYAAEAVGPYQEAVEELLARLSQEPVTAAGPPGQTETALIVQRVHGDLHLGQVLLETLRPSGEQRWLILDFEGEPLRPIAERNLPDTPWRDVVGLLRSFDYAAVSAGGPATPRSNWREQCVRAFLEGYGLPLSVTGTPLFQALYLDKALYEVVYELRHRPDWVAVPVSAVHRILQVSPTTAIGAGVAAAPDEAPELPAELLSAIAEGRHHDPHAVLGVHPLPSGRFVIRTLRHLAAAVELVLPGKSGESGEVDSIIPMRHLYGGIWVAETEPLWPGSSPDYRVRARYQEGAAVLLDDSYRFPPFIGELDVHLFSEGRHERLWTVLGAQHRSYASAFTQSGPARYGGEAGTTESGFSFVVWAPRARAVRVAGDFNDWDGRVSSMRSLGFSGLWEIFVPGVPLGARYKFELLDASGAWLERADPMAFSTEIPPRIASVTTRSEYRFHDESWLTERAAVNPHNAPMSVYEVHLGSWRPGLGYTDLARELVAYVQWMGFTHVEFMPVAEHPYGGSWGYQVTSYYAPTSRFGHPDEFRYLIDAFHQAGIGVILDWVPAHFPRDGWALARFDGEPLYEHPDPQRGEHPDWGTLIFDYGRPEVRNFLVANALYWFEEFHIDGLRVDAVASMLYLDYSRAPGHWSPNRWGGRENLEAISFLQEVNATVYRSHPGAVMIAEESTAFPGVTSATDRGGLGFGLKWNMGWMHDSLAYMAQDPVNRAWHHDAATFSLAYAFDENFLLPISHDEVVHGKGSLLRKMPGDRWQQLANLRAFLAWQWAHPGKQLIFMGTEFAQEGEWSEQYGLDWWLADLPAHRGVQLLVRELNQLYRKTQQLWDRDSSAEGFRWLVSDDAERNVLAFLREDAAGRLMCCVVNFAGVSHHGYRLGLPRSGSWREVLNTDAVEFGGSGVGNGGAVQASEMPWAGQPASAELVLPPLATLFLFPPDSPGSGG